jgi:hypothetical protein
MRILSCPSDFKDKNTHEKEKKLHIKRKKVLLNLVDLEKMFEEIFDVKRGRNLLDMFLSPIEDDGMLKDFDRWDYFARKLFDFL